MSNESKLNLARNKARENAVQKNSFEGSQSPLRKGMHQLDQLKRESDAQAIARRNEKIRQLENRLQESREMILELVRKNLDLESKRKTLEEQIQGLKTNHSTLSLMAQELAKEKNNSLKSGVSRADKPKPFCSQNPNTAVVKKTERSPRLFSAKAREAAGLQPICSKTPTLNRPPWR